MSFPATKINDSISQFMLSDHFSYTELGVSDEVKDIKVDVRR